MELPLLSKKRGSFRKAFSRGFHSRRKGSDTGLVQSADGRFHACLWQAFIHSRLYAWLCPGQPGKEDVKIPWKLYSSRRSDQPVWSGYFPMLYHRRCQGRNRPELQFRGHEGKASESCCPLECT